MGNGAGGCVWGLDSQQPWSDDTRGQHPGSRDVCPQSIIGVTLSWVRPPADVSAELTGPPYLPYSPRPALSGWGDGSPKGFEDPGGHRHPGGHGAKPTPVLKCCFCVSEPAVPNGRTQSSLEVLSIKSQKLQYLCNIQNRFFRASSC